MTNTPGARTDRLRRRRLSDRLVATGGRLSPGPRQPQLDPGDRQAHQRRRQNQVLNARLRPLPGTLHPIAQARPAPYPYRTRRRGLSRAPAGTGTRRHAGLRGRVPPSRRDRGDDLTRTPPLRSAADTLYRPRENGAPAPPHRRRYQLPPHRRMAQRHSARPDAPLVLCPAHRHAHLTSPTSPAVSKGRESQRWGNPTQPMSPRSTPPTVLAIDRVESPPRTEAPMETPYLIRHRTVRVGGPGGRRPFSRAVSSPASHADAAPPTCASVQGRPATWPAQRHPAVDPPGRACRRRASEAHARRQRHARPHHHPPAPSARDRRPHDR